MIFTGEEWCYVAYACRVTVLFFNTSTTVKEYGLIIIIPSSLLTFIVTNRRSFLLLVWHNSNSGYLLLHNFWVFIITFMHSLVTHSYILLVRSISNNNCYLCALASFKREWLTRRLNFCENSSHMQIGILRTSVVLALHSCCWFSSESECDCA